MLLFVYLALPFATIAKGNAILVRLKNMSIEKINEIKHNISLRKWALEIKECQESGLSIKEWCKTRNMHYATYFKHQKSVREAMLDLVPKSSILAEKPSNEVSFAEVTPKLNPCFNTTIPENSINTKCISMNLNGISIEIGNNANEVAIAAVLRAVKSL